MTLVGLVVLIGARDADPAAGIAAERLVRERAQVATDALDTLRAAIQPGLDDARRAAAAVLSADEPPGSLLVAAGESIAAADEAAVTARRAVASLNGARSALGDDLAPLAEPIAVGELPSIGAQLAAAAPAADAFFELRRRAVGLPETLEAALAALDRGDLEAADELVTRAREDHALVVASDAEPVTLPVWIATTDAMITAMEQIVSATRAGDAAAASAAAEAFTRAHRRCGHRGPRAAHRHRRGRILVDGRAARATRRGARRHRGRARDDRGDCRGSRSMSDEPRGEPDTPDPMVGRTLAERYRIEATIARGGMARVYRARDVRLERDVAIKILSPPFSDDPAFAERFLAEARAAASLSHPSLDSRVRLGQRRHGALHRHGAPRPSPVAARRDRRARAARA